MLKDQFPDAKYAFRGLIPTKIKLPKSTPKWLLNLQFWKCKKPNLWKCMDRHLKHKLLERNAWRLLEFGLFL